jgi:probable HAF family extracellular repeat protein
MMANLLKVCAPFAVRLQNLVLALAILLALSAGYPLAVAQTFEGLGLPGDTYSAAIAVNADGTVVVGTSSTTVRGQAFRWTSTGGMVGLGYLPGNSQSFAAAVNSDGSVVVGYSSQNGGVSPQAIRWTNPSGLIGLGYLSGNNSSAAVGVSADGSFIVGNSYTSGNCCNNLAFRWTAASSVVGLGSVSGYPVSYAAGVNADGSVVVGVSYVADLSQDQAFRWTSAGGMVELGYLPGGNNSFANAVNADGSVLVGGSTTANDAHNYEAFRWTQNGGMMGLSYLSGHNSSNSIAVNADGSVVVGCSGLNGNCNQAFLWTAVDGMKSVQALLTAEGVSTAGWTLTSAQGVSADGQVIVGYGVDSNGRTQGWIATLIVNPPAMASFSAFSAKLNIYFTPNQYGFAFLSNFTLGSTSNGINPVTETVILQIGTFTITIPPGSFQEPSPGDWTFVGVINGVTLEAVIRLTAPNQYIFGVTAQKVNLIGTQTPVTVTLTIGDDSGTTQAVHF